MKPKSKKWDAEKYERPKYAHLKLDGHFTRVVDGKFFSSQDTELAVPEHIRRGTEDQHGAIWLGELWVPGKPASFVKSALKDSPGELQITYFAVENFDEGHRLEALRRYFEDLKLDFAEFLVDQSYTDESLLELAKTRGAEGWMLKNGNMLDWYKLKATETVDCVVTGHEEGKRQHLGLVGSLIGSVYDGTRLVEIARVGGFDMETREAISDKVPMGAVMEVAYQYVGSQGRLRHPRFIRFRDDKLPTECTKDQLG